jgi:hypothetical protein
MGKKRHKRHKDHGVTLHHILGEGWVHTHGMDRHGLPELEVKGVPGFLAPAAANMLMTACQYMIESRKAVKAGEGMTFPAGVVVQFTKPEPAPGDEDHYEVERLRMEDVEATCDCCGLPAGKHG